MRLSVKSRGGRGGERRRRSEQASLAILTRLRRLEYLLLTLLDPPAVRWVTDTILQNMLEVIKDGHRGDNTREAVQILDKGPDVGQGEGDDGIDGET